MIYLSNEPYPQEISVPRSFGVIVPHRNEYLSTADIAADLTTDSDTKVLAASQGVELKRMVDRKADASDVYTKTEVDTALQGKADKSDTYTKAQVDSALGGKQDTISDLSAIRSGAAAGATAVQPSGLEAGLATKQDTLVSGTNIKTINNESLLGSGNITIQGGGGSSDAVLYTEQSLTSEQQAQARTNIGAGTYSKPANGIPASDLASGVIPSVPTKTSDLQNDSGFVTGQEVSQTYETKSDATAKETALQNAINTKQDTLESGVNIKTINNQSLLGSGNIDIQGGGGGTIDNEVTKDSANAVKSSGIYSALGKYGVITQNINWTGNNTTGFEASTSNPVYGLIPQFFIDLVTAEGAVFNATTGYFELNGITDIAYDEMQEMYAKRTGEGQTWVGSIYHGLNYGARTCFPVFRGFGLGYVNHELTTMHIKYAGVGATGLNTHNSNLVIFALTDDLTILYGANANNFGNSFDINYTLKKVLGVFNVQNNGLLFYPGAVCPKLESFQMRGLNTNLNLSGMPSLDTASIAYVINYAGTTNITITLHATAYARAIADAAVQAALAAHTNVTLASN